MSGRDSLPHFPAPEKVQQRPPAQSQGKMYPNQPQYQPTSGVPGAYPPAGYQVGPPGTQYGAAQQGYQPAYGQSGYNTTQGSIQRSAASQPSQVPQGIDPQLYNLFRSADVNNSGELNERELSRALVNGDWTPFDPKTVKLMVKMFDVDQYHTISNAN